MAIYKSSGEFGYVFSKSKSWATAYGKSDKMFTGNLLSGTTIATLGKPIEATDNGLLSYFPTYSNQFLGNTFSLPMNRINTGIKIYAANTVNCVFSVYRDTNSLTTPLVTTSAYTPSTGTMPVAISKSTLLSGKSFLIADAGNIKEITKQSIYGEVVNGVLNVFSNSSGIMSGKSGNTQLGFSDTGLSAYVTLSYTYLCIDRIEAY
ncbi:hypothetical protein [Levilactobacillus andaensis]|uniref:hypothetical protein n=1 Tax=Levilactobacillus andaensis TaxID=2799570 RepID=UPI001940AD82|nr:hypothetical protein [Levilactobacillus andaensis]